MKNIHEDLKHLFVEIPEISSADSHEKMYCILILYSKMLANLFHAFNISDHFGRLHIMSYDMKAIMNKHVKDHVKQATFNKTRTMLIQDMYQLIKLTEATEDGLMQAQ